MIKDIYNGIQERMQEQGTSNVIEQPENALAAPVEEIRSASHDAAIQKQYENALAAANIVRDIVNYIRQEAQNKPSVDQWILNRMADKIQETF